VSPVSNYLDFIKNPSMLDGMDGVSIRVFRRSGISHLWGKPDLSWDVRYTASAQLHRAFGPRVDPGSASGLREGIPMWIPRDGLEAHSDGNRSTQ
jgi:hypothetical protein